MTPFTSPSAAPATLVSPVLEAIASARSVRGGPGGAFRLAALLGALLASVPLLSAVHALETPVAADQTGATSKAGMLVKIGVVERTVELDWARARHLALDLNPSRTRLAPSAEATVKALVGQLALGGDKRERYLLYTRAADPKPSAPDLQLSARIVRNALVAAAGAPQDAIVVASWTATGDPPAAADAIGGVPAGGFLLVPIRATSDAAMARGLALDSAFTGVAELLAGPTKSESKSPPSSVETASHPTKPIAVSAAATPVPTPPAPPMVAAVKPERVPVAVPTPAAPRPVAPTPSTANAQPRAPDLTGSVPTPSRVIAALLPLPKARPAAPKAEPRPVATPVPRPQTSTPAPRAEAKPKSPTTPAPRVTVAQPPAPPVRPIVRPTVVKAEPDRRAPTRIADCAPPRIILDDFYRGGPIVGCDGRRR